MKIRNNQKGFSALEAVLLLVIVGLIGVAGWNVLHSRAAKTPVSTVSSTASAPSASRTTNTKPAAYKVPDGYSVFKNDDVSFAYPDNWKASSTLDFITVVNDDKVVVYQGCGDEACAVRYNPSARKWSSTNQETGTEVVAEDNVTQAYLMPIKGALNCGSYSALIHNGNKFAQLTLSVCTEPKTTDEIKPSGSQLLYDTVVNQLKEVVKSYNKV